MRGDKSDADAVRSVSLNYGWIDATPTAPLGSLVNLESFRWPSPEAIRDHASVRMPGAASGPQEQRGFPEEEGCWEATREAIGPPYVAEVDARSADEVESASREQQQHQQQQQQQRRDRHEASEGDA